MRRLIACGVLAPLLLMTWTLPAHAGKSADIALGLASFAVFNQIVAPLIRPPHVVAAPHRHEVVYRTVVTRPVVYRPAPVVYTSPAPVVYAPPPAPAPPTTVVYPHGRYELQPQGYQYVWVWIPTVAPPPPPPAALAPPYR
jgi:hypothetical protein